MSDPFASTRSVSPALEVLGLGSAGEEAYRTLLRSSGASVPELAAQLALPPARVRSLLAELSAKGLVTTARQRPRRYRAVPPDIVLEALIQRQTDALARAGAAAAALIEEFRPQTFRVAPGDDVIEVLGEEAHVRRVIAEIQRGATNECLCLDKPPYVTGPPHTVDPAEIEGLARGVAYRTLIDVEAFDAPGVLDRVRACVEAGAEVRVGAGLSLKLLIVDGRIGLIPMHLEALGGPVLLLRASSLLEALRDYFDLLWRQAAPLSAADLSRTEADPRSALDTEQHLLARLAAGSNDKATAAALGLSPRTLDRRIGTLMKRIGARTRFQAGWLAAHRFGTPERA
jgi:sugar-specific transcriptional regulator TrmB/DNA-binding CsgD family transcriptional regulator